MKAKIIDVNVHQDENGEYVVEPAEEKSKKEFAKQIAKKVLKGLVIGLCGGIAASFFIVTAATIAQAAKDGDALDNSDDETPELKDLDVLADELASQEQSNENELLDNKEEI